MRSRLRSPSLRPALDSITRFDDGVKGARERPVVPARRERLAARAKLARLRARAANGPRNPRQ